MPFFSPRIVLKTYRFRLQADASQRTLLEVTAGLVASACGGNRVSGPVKQDRDHAVRLPSCGEELCHAG